MRQAIMTEPGEIEFWDVPDLSPKEGEILLRIQKMRYRKANSGDRS